MRQILGTNSTYSRQFLTPNVVSEHIEYVNHSPVCAKSYKLHFTAKPLTCTTDIPTCQFPLCQRLLKQGACTGKGCEKRPKGYKNGLETSGNLLKL